jgi:hypothetical protein
VEDVCDNVSEVQQNPATKTAAFATQCLGPVRQHLVFDFVGYRLHVSFVSTGDDDERIDNSDRSADIESHDVFALFGFRGGGDYGDVGDGVGGCWH